jgi:hypothetical protein
MRSRTPPPIAPKAAPIENPSVTNAGVETRLS